MTGNSFPDRISYDALYSPWYRERTSFMKLLSEKRLRYLDSFHGILA